MRLVIIDAGYIHCDRARADSALFGHLMIVPTARVIEKIYSLAGQPRQVERRVDMIKRLSYAL